MYDVEMFDSTVTNCITFIFSETYLLAVSFFVNFLLLKFLILPKLLLFLPAANLRLIHNLELYIQ